MAGRNGRLEAGEGRKVKITVEQIRAARRLLHWSQFNLAVRSGVGFVTVRRIERRHPGSYDLALLKLQAVFEAAGVAGVRLRK
jgi:transcriptional regulator with XRE-family HTH domain